MRVRVRARVRVCVTAMVRLRVAPGVLNPTRVVALLLFALCAVLHNEGKGCWYECGRKQGRCDYCGNGMCCRLGWVGGGCDGSHGTSSGHHGCVAASSPAPSSDGDLRVSCKASAASTVLDVDLAFYNVSWYAALTQYTSEKDVCFHRQGGAATSPTPRRKNLLSGEVLGLGNAYNYDGSLVAERACDALDDFALDFDDRGIGGNISDGTEWGIDGGAKRCGTTVSRGVATAMRSLGHYILRRRPSDLSRGKTKACVFSVLWSARMCTGLRVRP